MAIKPIPPINVPIAGQATLTEPWSAFLSSLEQFGRSSPAFPTAEVALANAAGVTLTAAQFLASVLLRTGPAGVFSDTTPTAAAIVAAIPKAEIGSNRLILISNGGGGTMTLLAGSGVTLQGNTTIAAGSGRFYLITATAIAEGMEAVKVRGLITAAM